LIKEGTEPQIAHLQHSVQQQQKYIDDLLAQQQQMQQRLQVLEQMIASNK
jgi:Tfp pilus assembly protein PilN